MRTKTLLLTAALVAAGAASSMAQVYSVNAVGYINLSIPKGFSIIANQLNASPNNQISTVLGNPSKAVVAYTFRNATGDYTINGYDPDFQSWDDPTQVIAPGTGVFINNPTVGNVAITLVGEVPQGALSTPVPHGFSLVASQVPQAGLIQTDLGYTPSSTGDTVYRFNNATGTYLIYNYDPDFASWDPEPPMNVGEGCFVFRSGTASTWTRNFTVN